MATPNTESKPLIEPNPPDDLPLPTRIDPASEVTATPATPIIDYSREPVVTASPTAPKEDLEKLFSMTLNWSLEEVKLEKKPVAYTQRMECPQCGFQQPKADECSQCGINILSYAEALQEKLMIQAGEYQLFAPAIGTDADEDEDTAPSRWQQFLAYLRQLFSKDSLSEEMKLAQQAGLLTDDLQARRKKIALPESPTPTTANQTATNPATADLADGFNPSAMDQPNPQQIPPTPAQPLSITQWFWELFWHWFRPNALPVPDAPQESLWADAPPDDAAATTALPKKNSNPILAAAALAKAQSQQSQSEPAAASTLAPIKHPAPAQPATTDQADPDQPPPVTATAEEDNAPSPASPIPATTPPASLSARQRLLAWLTGLGIDPAYLAWLGLPTPATALNTAHSSESKSKNAASPDHKSDRKQAAKQAPPAVLDAPTTRHEAFALYLGKNIPLYLHRFKAFEAVDEQGQAIEEYAITWHWPAFWLPFGWFFYRKLYLWAGLALVSMIVPILANIAWALTAYYLYYRHISKRITTILATEPPNRQARVLQTTGGVQAWVLAIGLLLLLALLGGLLLFLLLPDASNWPLFHFMQTLKL